MTPPKDSEVRVRRSGKFLRLAGEKFIVRGFSYGPFAPNSSDEPLPERNRLRDDFAHMRTLGANALRVYFPPPEWLLDEALDHGLRVFVDVPWEKHRCFFEDWDARERARREIRTTASTLGQHPGLLAISVANEFPVDIVRFYGRHRVARFVEELLDTVKQEAPDCLATFVNFPTTEFLEPRGCDFCCFNVYVHDEARLGRYLDRLQHIAGDRPLMLGEYGIDSVREGDVEQAELLSKHLQRVYRHGLAGSFVFAYTDDWFTGGYQIEDWAFGVTDRDRAEKPAAKALRRLWQEYPPAVPGNMPTVSVVVCSYNGAATLRECLDSLMRLDYPDYEVILVDDGSTDGTRQIAEDFPSVLYHYQENRGLSAARNVGAELAQGEIVAYTDDDCVVDEHWLRHLVQSMQDQQVEAIGGPNITPNDDGWVARCVAASPGNPSHVMLDDQHAEHVPGCNMAFRRDTLLWLVGFDPQFRQAGDDVDICWRMLDADLPIGYAPGAMVWHRRRATVKAYARQQQGYGRSEGMVHFKHPGRCGTLGRSTWQGIIYGDGAAGLPMMPQTIYHGRFGSGLFQTIYRHNRYGMWGCLLTLEWHLTALFVLILSTLFWPLGAISLLMWTATLVLAIHSARTAHLPRKAPWWCRPLVAYLYIMQPIWRGWHRMTHLLGNKRLPMVGESPAKNRLPVKRISATVRDLYWNSQQGVGRERLLEELVGEARRIKWAGDFDNAWADWDVKLVGDRWHDITIRTATEELGWPQRFTRARMAVHPTVMTQVTAAAAIAWSTVGVFSGQSWAMLLGAVACVTILVSSLRSRSRCLKATTALVARAAQLAELETVSPAGDAVSVGEEAEGPDRTSALPVSGHNGIHETEEPALSP